MVIREELAGIIELLKKNGNDNPIFEAHLIVRYYLKMTPMDIVLEAGREIEENTLKLINSAVERRCKNEPLQYILNSQEFMGLDFYVDENVLIPRADTETLVEHILEHFRGKAFTALDIGTGSGCISISLAHFCKGAYVRGIDISKNAVAVAEKNAAANGVSDRVCFENADIFKYSCYGRYDLIVSNPPYIESGEIEKLDDNVRLYEPRGALDGGADGLDYYRHIIDFSPSVLSNGGMLAFETGHTQARAVAKMMEKSFDNIRIVKDLCGIERVVSGLLRMN